MTPQPPAFQAPTLPDSDAQHLKLLAIFQFIFGGFAFVGTVFLAFHYMMMRTIFMSPEFQKTPQGGGPTPQEFMDVFIWFYVIMGAFLLIILLASVLCGTFLLKRKNRAFCLVAAGLQCLMVPLGTVLGIFTIMVLIRPSVQVKFAASP